MLEAIGWLDRHVPFETYRWPVVGIGLAVLAFLLLYPDLRDWGVFLGLPLRRDRLQRACLRLAERIEKAFPVEEAHLEPSPRSNVPAKHKIAQEIDDAGWRQTRHFRNKFGWRYRYLVELLSRKSIDSPFMENLYYYYGQLPKDRGEAVAAAEALRRVASSQPDRAPSS